LELTPEEIALLVEFADMACKYLRHNLPLRGPFNQLAIDATKGKLWANLELIEKVRIILRNYYNDSSLR